MSEPNEPQFTQSPYGEPLAPPIPAKHSAAASHRGWLIAVVVALLIGGGAGFGIGHATAGSGSSSDTSNPGVDTITVSGTMTLADLTSISGELGTDDDACSGTGGYSDIAEGAQVVVTDDTGKTLVITQLGAGTIIDGGCEFPFTAEVPKGKGFYGFTVTHRGTVKEAEADLAGGVALTIGN